MFENEKSLKDLKYATWVILLTMTGATAWGIVTGNLILSFGGLAAIISLFVFLIFADKRLRAAVRKRIYDENVREFDIDIDTLNDPYNNASLGYGPNQPYGQNPTMANNPNANHPVLPYSPQTPLQPNQYPQNAVAQQMNNDNQISGPQQMSSFPQNHQGPPQHSSQQHQGPTQMQQVPQAAAPQQPIMNPYQRYFGPSLAVVLDGDKTYVFGPFRSTDEALDWEPGARILFKKMMSGQNDVIMRGMVKAIPIASPEAKHYIEKADGMILPSNPEWDFIRN